MPAEDINGKRINNWDRITRNGLFLMAFSIYAFQFIAPYFIAPPVPPIDPALMKGLEAIITGLFWFLIGRNTQPAKET